MKINESNRIGGTNPYSKQADFRAESAKKAKQKDEVQISAEAKEMLTTSKLNGTERAEQLEQLKKSVASGTYHVDAGKIAEKLLPYLK
ncbi:MAG: anti-sigma-28 factor, FlgM [Paenibacillus sp.]|nr:anti-sigma-28 factor, FlgM [Paenibacillus sp.]